MRQIKFRAWDEKEKKMWLVGGFPLLSEQGWIANLVSSEKPFNKELSDTDGELMQFTGLKDKNGKEIYEGDIIKIPKKPYDYMESKNSKFMAAVIFDKGMFVLREEVEDWGALGEYENLKVIGNIYENPDLLNNL